MNVFKNMIAQFHLLDDVVIHNLQARCITRCNSDLEISQQSYDDLLMSYINNNVTDNSFYSFYINNHASESGYRELEQYIKTLK